MDGIGGREDRGEERERVRSEYCESILNVRVIGLGGGKEERQ